MKKAVTISVAMLFAVVVSAGTDRDNSIHVHSIVQLVVAPSNFAGKVVQLHGYYGVRPPGSFLYLTKEHALMSDTTNAVRLWKTLDGTDMNSHKKCTERFLSVQGRYTKMDFGGYGLADIELAVVMDVGDETPSGICYRHSSRGG